MQRPGTHVPHATRSIRSAVLTALLLGLGAGPALAQANKVFRCTGANGKVTLSDRRCPEDDPAAKPDAGKSDASPKPDAAKSPAIAASQLKACSEIKARVAEHKRQPRANDPQRTALRELEDEQRRHCGA
jgi:hypothetical protein